MVQHLCTPNIAPRPRRAERGAGWKHVREGGENFSFFGGKKCKKCVKKRSKKAKGLTNGSCRRTFDKLPCLRAGIVPISNEMLLKFRGKRTTDSNAVVSLTHK